VRKATGSSAIAGAPDPLLRLFADGRPRTRSDVTAETGHARSTVRQRLDALVDLGLLLAMDHAPSTGGRRPETFSLAPQARSLIAVELDPSFVRVVSLDLGLSVVADRSENLDTTRNPEDVLDAVIRLAKDVGEANPCPVAGIGVSLPMPLAPTTYLPVRPPLMPGWDGFDVAAYLADRTGVPVSVDRENYIVALAEQAHDPDASADFLMVRFSTWVGAGAVVEGRVVRGSRNSAGHLGHVVGPWPERDPCACGNRGCLEAVASGRAILRAIGERVGATTTQDLVDLANKGDTEVLQAVREAGRKLGLVLAGYVSVLNPARIVLDGLLTEAGFELLNGVRETIYANSFASSAEDLAVTLATTGRDAAVLGAGALALERFLAEGEGS
jgi:predicted NBD/HSP70 family sugar kinase